MKAKFLFSLLILTLALFAWHNAEAADILSSISDSQLDSAWKIAVSGSYAYVTAPEIARFIVINISNPASPSIVTSLSDPALNRLDGAYNIFISGNYAYVTSRYAERLNVIDISNPALPVIVGSIQDGVGGVPTGHLDTPIGVSVSGNYAYVAVRYENRFTVINISNPVSPSYVTSIQDNTLLDGAWDIFVSGNYAYVTGRDSDYLTIVDIVNPASPFIKGSVQIRPATANDSPYNVVVYGKYAYVTLRGLTEGAQDGGDGFVIVDVSNPANPQVKGAIYDNYQFDGAKGVQVFDNNYAYVTSYDGDRFNVIDISNPDSPTIADSITDTRLGKVNGISVLGKYAYAVADGILGDGIGYFNVITGFPTANVWGYGWSENIGWLSFHLRNCDTNENGRIDAGDSAPAGCPAIGTVVPNYGVNIDTVDGLFSGHAWSENIGWVGFSAEDLTDCPILPCEAKVDLVTKQVSGWAKALAGSNSNVWTAMAPAPDNVWRGASLTYTGGDFIYAFRGGLPAGSTDFYRYSISSNSWTTMASAPAVVYAGGSLTYAGGDFIYAFMGNWSNSFYSYSISSNSWTSMAPALNVVGYGGSLTYGGKDFIYAIRGEFSRDFYKYSISQDIWTPLTQTPVGTDIGGSCGTTSIYSGASLVYGGGDYVYALRGCYARDFWRYSISNNSWTTMAQTPSTIPVGGIWCSGSSNLAYTGGDYIFAFKVWDTTDFYRYSISSNSWTIVAPAPAGVDKGGGLVYAGGEYIYAFRANNTTDFWRYSVGSGWDGWIRLRDTNYGVWINNAVSPAEFRDWAWGENVIGWLSFNCLNQGVCGSSNYKVYTSFGVLNQPPNKPVVPASGYPDGETWSHCSIQNKSVPTFHWDYSDPESNPQTAYEVWVDDNSGFPDPKFNHKANSSSNSYALDLTQDDNSNWLSSLAWNQTYYWKVRTWDNGTASEWSNVDSFTTPLHAYPWPKFIYSPPKPTVNEKIQFTDQSAFYNSGSSWLWDLGDGYTTTTQNFKHAYSLAGSYCVQLRATDSNGYSCITDICPPTAPVNVGLPLPKWIEIPPISWLAPYLSSANILETPILGDIVKGFGKVLAFFDHIGL